MNALSSMRAILALIDGVRDEKDLASLGDLLPILTDIHDIAEQAVMAAEEDEGDQDRTYKAISFVEEVAALKQWGESDPDNDGDPYNDGDPFEPSDGLDDSHACLMNLIDMARDLVGETEESALAS